MNEIGISAINVKVLFFGAARDATGAAEIIITIPFPASVISVKEAAFNRYEGLSRFTKTLLTSVNLEYASDETQVKNLDEIAFLPPVSGG